MKKFLIWIFILLIVASFVAFKAKNTIVKSILENCTGSMTNLELAIGGVDINIRKHNLVIKNLKLYNPPGFEEAAMVDIPYAYINYSLGAAILRRVHFHILKIDLKELLIVRNQDGHLNFMRIKGLKRPGAPRRARKGFKIDKLYLSIGKVIYKDYLRNDPPLINVYNVNIRDQLFENVDDPKALVSAVMYKALMQTDIPQLLNFNMNVLRENLRGVADKGGVMLKRFQSKATQTIKDTTKDIKQTIKSLFKEEVE